MRDVYTLRDLAEALLRTGDDFLDARISKGSLSFYTPNGDYHYCNTSEKQAGVWMLTTLEKEYLAKIEANETGNGD